MQHRILTGLAAIAFALGAVLTGFAPAAAQSNFYREVTFDSARVVTVDVASSSASGFADATLLAFQISCTEDSGTATLDIALQRSIDGGTTWSNIVAMTQLSATGTETKLYADVRAASAQMIGNLLRVNYDVTGSGTYTCATKAAAEA